MNENGAYLPLPVVRKILTPPRQHLLISGQIIDFSAE